MSVLNSVTLWGGGKQPEDRYTRELPELETAAPTIKRGRGRPRLDNALTPAERAQRYRDRKKVKKAASARFKAMGVTGLYRGPNGEVWTGRGLVPRWLAVQIASGYDRQAFWVAF